MNSTQVWYLLIFSVPFVPAIIVFLMIKPEGGDAKVGGTLPIFKDLKLELAGAIATYVVITILGIIAFVVLMKNEAVPVSFRLIPTTPTKQAANVRLIDWQRLVATQPILKLKLGGDNDRNLGNFRISDNQTELISSDEIKFSRGDFFNKRINLVFQGDPLQSIFDTSATLEDVIKIRLLVAGDMFSDWVVEFDWSNESYDLAANSVAVRKVFLFTSGAADGLKRIGFGSWSKLGTKELRLTVFRVKSDYKGVFLNKIGTAFAAPLQSSEIVNMLSDSVSELAKKSTQDGTTRVEGSSNNLLVGEPLRERSAAILLAPSPRVVLEPPVMFGESLLVQLESKGDIPKDWKKGPGEYSQNYDYSTAESIYTVSISETAKLCNSGSAVWLDGPDGTKTALSSSDVASTGTTAAFRVRNAFRGSKLSVPQTWEANECI